MIKKTRDEVIDSIVKRLQGQRALINGETGTAFATEPGSVARTFTEVLSEEFSSFYGELDLVSTMGFVSTAKGVFLDLIGQLVNCARRPNESDNNYRVRITNQVYVVAGANQTAIRLKALNVEGVKDVVLEEYVKGPGSFAVYVITNDPYTSDTTLNAVRNALNEGKGFGVYIEVKRPILIPFALMVNVIFEEGTTESTKASIKETMRRNLRDYVDNIPLGGRFVISEAIRIAKSANAAVIDVRMNKMIIDEVERFANNLQASTGERIYLENVTIV